MPSFTSISLVLLPFLAVFGGVFQRFIHPRFELLGIYRHFGYPPIQPLNNERCQLIEGELVSSAGAYCAAMETNPLTLLSLSVVKELQGCEDLWAHPTLPYIYAPCSPPFTRILWMPAVSHLHASKLPENSLDHVYLYNTKSGKTKKVDPVGLPAGHRGLWLQGIGVQLHGSETDDGDGEKMTIFLNSHYPPQNRSLAPTLGADSVVEVFETTVGAETMRWTTTIQEEEVRTPNSMAAVGGNKVYITNDHKEKINPLATLEILHDFNPADVVVCDADLPAGKRCKVVIEKFSFPNGIVAGPNNLLYVTSSLQGDVQVYERQADDSLVFLEEIKLPRLVDNLRIHPSGAVTGAATPDGLAFAGKYLNPENIAKRKGERGTDIEGTEVSPSEIWLIKNETGQDRFFGKKYSVEPIFADLGNLSSGVTTGLIKDGKVYATGLLAPWVTACELPEDIAAAEFSS